jgi:hypothetical protein
MYMMLKNIVFYVVKEKIKLYLNNSLNIIIKGGYKSKLH